MTDHPSKPKKFPSLLRASQGAQVEQIPPDTIWMPNRRVRKTDADLIRRWVRNIEEFGVLLPFLIDESNQLLYGEQALSAAIALKMSKVPAIRVSNLSDADKRLLRIALDRLGELPEWDEAALAEEFADLIRLDADVSASGFDMPEIDLLILDHLPRPFAEALDEIPVATSGAPVSRLGDVWRVGRHFVGCGDARDGQFVESLMGGKKAQAVFADPPYGIPIAGFASGTGGPQHADFAMGVGEMSDIEFQQFLAGFLSVASSHLSDGAVIFTCMDWRHIDILVGAGKSLDLDLLNICVWTKPNGGMGSLYRSQHELVAVFKVGSGRAKNNIQLGKFGRNRSNVWAYSSANTFNAEMREALEDHPTPKPVELVADAIRDVSDIGETVFDPFLGGGTTLVAAHNTRRTCVGVELDPRYVDVSLKRWIKLTGKQPIHSRTGLSFDEMAAERSSEPLSLIGAKGGDQS
ncbi:DNA modification methylase [Pyruvatibacter sp.]